MGWRLGLLSKVTQETKIKEVEGKQIRSPEKIGSMGRGDVGGWKGKGRRERKHEGMRRKRKDRERKERDLD